ncbi:MAG: PAS domain S-box protein [Bacteroidia bacterium]|nr:PAS domain S-box protein [Bacteroidia bacterium]MDW8300852.1 PAS domain S-box protein [Bacteroidia bacterium]
MENTYYENIYAQTLDNCTAAVVSFNYKGDVLFFSQSAEVLWGYSQEEVLNKPLQSLILPEYLTNIQKYFNNQAFTNTEPYIEIVRKDGKKVPTLIATSQALDANQNIVFTAFFIDISKQKQKERDIESNLTLLKQKNLSLEREIEQMKEEKLLYEGVLNTSIDAILVINEDGIIEKVNTPTERIFGYSLQEMLGQNISMLMPEPYASEHDNYIKQYKITGIKKVIGVGREVEAKRKDGSVFPVEIAIGETYLKSGKRIFTGFIRNISERKSLENTIRQQLEQAKAVEEELRQNMEELQATQEAQARLGAALKASQADIQAKMNAINASYGYIELSAEGYFLSANDIFLNDLEYTAEEVYGKHHSTFIEPAYAQSEEYKKFWQQLREGKNISSTFKRLTKNKKEVWFDATYSPVKDEQGKVVKVIKLAKNVTRFTQALKKNSEFLLALKEGNLNIDFDATGIIVEGELKSMIDTNIVLRNTLQSISEDIKKVIQLAGKEGILSTRLQSTAYQGVWKEIIEGINTLLENISTPILGISEILNNVAEGDLTRKFTQPTQGDIYKIATALNQAIANLQTLIQQIQVVAKSVAKIANEVATQTNSTRQSTKEVSLSIQQMADGAQEQAIRIDESSRLVEATLKSAQEISTKAAAINLSAEKGQINCQNGLTIVESVSQNMNDISNSAQISAQAIEVLINRSEEISRILNVITDIASQTNLLALNAAIEAARAGDAGRGFAVVAEEIRKLAEGSRKSTVEIDKLIKSIQKDVSSTSKAIEKVQENVTIGNAATKKAVKILNDINNSSTETLQLSKSIADASVSQKEAIGAVVKNIEKIVVVSEETASGSQEIASSARAIDQAISDISQGTERLAKIAETLQSQVAKFKLSEQ